MTMVKAIHKWWVFKVALTDEPITVLRGYASLSVRWGYVLQPGFRVMTIVYPICFIILICSYAPLMVSFFTIDEMIFLLEFFLILGWSFFAYLTMIFWFWYKKQCHTISKPSELSRIRSIMKIMLAASPYYMAVHVIFFFLANMILLKEELFYVVVLLLPIDWIFFYLIYRNWIRISTYPLRTVLRTKRFRNCRFLGLGKFLWNFSTK